MNQKLPDLPYDFNALEPVIKGEIMELHYSKHHATYVNNLNKALEDYAEAEKQGAVETMIRLEPAIRFNGGGHINHSIFWTNLAPQSKGGGGSPSGDLLESVNHFFGSFEAFQTQMTQQTVAIQGSGWGWLGWNPVNKRLEITTCSNQDPLVTKGLIPLLGIDVWEHAYYLQYKNVRPDYVKNIWNIVNWKNVEMRLEMAKSGKQFASV